MNNLTFDEALAMTQGIFYFLTGVWPIVDIRSFQKVTGPKTDLWLVKTVGSLVAVVGAALFFAGFNSNITFEIFLLAAGCAAALTVVDVNYVRKGTISKIYLLDAAVELALIAFWILAYCLSAG